VIQGPKKGRIVYTVGSSNRKAEEFLNLLKIYGIKVLVDVRSFPTSKFEHFKRGILEEILLEKGIEYFYLGEELGGYRKGGYEKHMVTEKFQSGLVELLRIAGLKQTAIMCAERFPWKCHRRFISQELEKKGWSVVHIIDEKRIWEPKSNVD